MLSRYGRWAVALDEKKNNCSSFFQYLGSNNSAKFCHSGSMGKFKRICNWIWQETWQLFYTGKLFKIFIFTSFAKVCLQKKNCWEGDIGPYRGEGGEKNPPFLVHRNGDIFLWGEGSKSFCLMSHVHFCASVSTQFVAFLEARGGGGGSVNFFLCPYSSCPI